MADVGNVLIDERTWPPLTNWPYREAALERLASVFGAPELWFYELFSLEQTVDTPGWVQDTHAQIAGANSGALGTRLSSACA